MGCCRECGRCSWHACPQIPNLHSTAVMSIVATCCSIGYASIGLGMSIGKATGTTSSAPMNARL